MSDDREPKRNISGGDAGGGRTTAFEAGTAETRAAAVVDRLGEIYWQKAYGGRDAFECLVRTILSQNTSDKVSQPACLDDLVVDEPRRGEGHGTELVDHVESWARDRDCEYVALACPLDRDETHAFYESLDYARWGYVIERDLRKAD